MLRFGGTPSKEIKALSKLWISSYRFDFEKHFIVSISLANMSTAHAAEFGNGLYFTLPPKSLACPLLFQS